MGTATPWGTSQYSKKLARGVVSYSTAGHGGIHVSKTMFAKMPKVFQNIRTTKQGWFEEDCEWAFVALSFPDLFSSESVESAHASVKNYWPEAYQAWRRETEPNYVLPVEESHALQRKAFEQANASNWVVISAVNAENNMVKCHATLGGKYAPDAKVFLVPQEEYKSPFIIDTQRHKEVA